MSVRQQQNKKIVTKLERLADKWMLFSKTGRDIYALWITKNSWCWNGQFVQWTPTADREAILVWLELITDPKNLTWTILARNLNRIIHLHSSQKLRNDKAIVCLIGEKQKLDFQLKHSEWRRCEDFRKSLLPAWLFIVWSDLLTLYLRVVCKTSV
jgi:hypothetical protein